MKENKLVNKLVRVDPQFERIISNIARRRIANGKDLGMRKMRSMRRLTLAVSRHPLMKKIEEDIAIADLEIE